MTGRGFWNGFGVIWVPLLIAVACSSSDADSSAASGDSTDLAAVVDAVDATAADGSAAAVVTYQGAARAALERSCTGCHTDGGIGPFPLDDYESASTFAGPAVAAIQSGRMPPWTPDPDCRSYQGERILSDSDAQAIFAWYEAGTPEGDLSEYTAPALGESLAPTRAADLVLVAEESFQPDAASPDDYHCFVMPFDFAAPPLAPKMARIQPSAPNACCRVSRLARSRSAPPSWVECWIACLIAKRRATPRSASQASARRPSMSSRDACSPWRIRGSVIHLWQPAGQRYSYRRVNRVT